MKASIPCNLCKYNLKNQPTIEKAIISWLTESNLPLYYRHEMQHFICQQVHCGLESMLEEGQQSELTEPLPADHEIYC